MARKANVYDNILKHMESLATSISGYHGEFCFDFASDTTEIETKTYGKLGMFPEDAESYLYIVNAIKELKASNKPITKNKIRKPKLGDKVYVLGNNSITLTTVEFLGDSSFLVRDYTMLSNGGEYFYSNFGLSWFNDLESAVIHLKRYFDFNPETETIKGEEISPDDGYWEIVDRD